MNTLSHRVFNNMINTDFILGKKKKVSMYWDFDVWGPVSEKTILCVSSAQKDTEQTDKECHGEH